MKELESLIVNTVDSYLKANFRDIVKECLEAMIREHSLVVGQEFIPIEAMAARYHISVRTLYNYHNREYITLRSSEGKTYVSLMEMEEHIRKHPVFRQSTNGAQVEVRSKE